MVTLTRLNSDMGDILLTNLTTPAKDCAITIPVVSGKSAYELAVENGFVGSLEDWLNSLTGWKPIDSDFAQYLEKQLQLSSLFNNINSKIEADKEALDTRINERVVEAKAITNKLEQEANARVTETKQLSQDLVNEASNRIKSIKQLADNIKSEGLIRTSEIEQMHGELQTEQVNRVAEINKLTNITIDQGQSIASVTEQLLTVGKTLNTKASAEVLKDTVSRVTTTEGKVEAHTAKLTQLNNVIEGKASSTALQSLSNTVTEVKGKVSSNSHAITQLEGSVTNINNKLITKADTSVLVDYYKIQDANQAITGKIEEYNASFEIGGRNYFKKSTSTPAYNGATVLDRDGLNCPNGFAVTGDSDGKNIVRLSKTINGNGWWTVSGWVMSNESVPVSFGVDMTLSGGKFIDVVETGQWQKFSVTFRVQNYTSDTFNFVDFVSFKLATYYFKDIKVEKGTKATDWTPAPEDVDQKFTDVNTNITTFKEAVATDKAAVAKQLTALDSKFTEANNKTQAKLTNDYLTKSDTNQAITNASTALSAVYDNKLKQKADTSVLNTYYTKAQADTAIANETKQIKTRLGQSSNLLDNSEFSPGFSGWNTVNSGAYITGLNNPNWHVPGINTPYIRQSGGNTLGKNEYVEVESDFIAVEAAVTYAASVYMGVHRCFACVFLKYYDANKILFSNSYLAESEIKPGGTNIAGYSRPVSIHKTPANTAYVKFTVRKYSTLPGNSDSWLFFMRPHLAKVADDCTEAPTYNASPNYSTLTQHSESIDGIKANWTLKLDVNGRISGMTALNDGRTAEFAITADNFYVGAVGSAYKPFQVKTTTWTSVDGKSYPSGVYINNAVIADLDAKAIRTGTIRADHIQIGSLGKDRLDATFTKSIDATKTASDKVTAAIKNSSDWDGLSDSLTISRNNISGGKDLANLWTNQLFDPAFPQFASTNLSVWANRDAWELQGSKGLELRGRYNIGDWSTRFYVKPGEKYHISFIGYNYSGVGFHTGLWVTNKDNKRANLVEWTGFVPCKPIGETGNNWKLWEAIYTVPSDFNANAPLAAVVHFFLNTEDYSTTHVVIGNLVVKKVVSESAIDPDLVERSKQAKQLAEDIVADNKITPDEKQTLLVTYKQIQNDNTIWRNQAYFLSLDYTRHLSAAQTLLSVSRPYLGWVCRSDALSQTDTLNAGERTILMDAITEYHAANKELAERVGSNLRTTGANATKLANDGINKANTAQGRADSAYNLANSANGVATGARDLLNRWKANGNGTLYIDNNSIAVKQIGAEQIATGSITADHIQIGSLDRDRLDPTFTKSIDDTKSKIDNLEVGGKNLLKNSKGIFTPNTSSKDNYAIYPASTVDMIKGKEYTLSGETNGEWSSNHDGTTESNKAVLWLVGNGINAVISNSDVGTKGRTFVWDNPSGTYTIRLNSYRANNSIWFKNIKIESGNKRTDWTPAPEDVQNSINTVSSVASGARDLLNRWKANANDTLYIDDNSIAVKTIGADQIAANAISADKIQAGVITADKLHIGDTTNYWGNQYFDASIKPYLGDGNAGACARGLATYIRDTNDYYTRDSMFYASKGDSFLFELTAYRDSGSGDLQAGFHFYDLSGTHVGKISSSLTMYADGDSGIGWSRFYAILTIPDNNKIAKVTPRFINSAVGQWRMGDLVINKRAKGNLIVDGSITADKISVKSLDAISANLGSIKVNNANIGVAQVDTLQIAGEAVIVPRLQYSETQSFTAIDTEVVINQVTMNAQGGAVSISFGFDSLRFAARNEDSNDGLVKLRIKRNGMVLRYKEFGINNGTRNGDYGQVIFLTFLDVPPAGDQVYTVTLESRKLNSGLSVYDQSAYPVVITSRSLHIMGVKR